MKIYLKLHSPYQINQHWGILGTIIGVDKCIARQRVGIYVSVQCHILQLRIIFWQCQIQEIVLAEEVLYDDIACCAFCTDMQITTLLCQYALSIVPLDAPFVFTGGNHESILGWTMKKRDLDRRRSAHNLRKFFGNRRLPGFVVHQT